MELKFNNISCTLSNIITTVGLVQGSEWHYESGVRVDVFNKTTGNVQSSLTNNRGVATFDFSEGGVYSFRAENINFCCLSSVELSRRGSLEEY